MKRVLCGLAVAAAAASAVPAHASESPVQVQYRVDGDRIGVGASYGTGTNKQPIGGAYVDPQTGNVCVGLSYQIPQCTGSIS